MSIEHEVLARLRKGSYVETGIDADGRVFVVVNDNARDVKTKRLVYGDTSLFRRAWGPDWPRVTSSLPLLGCQFQIQES